MDATGRALVAHWSWASEKGLMNSNTAGALRAACANVLSVLEDWETLDVRKLDIEQALIRFQNLKGQEFKPDSLEAYKRRFRQAVASFLEYADDPGGWKPGSQRRQAKVLQRVSGGPRQKSVSEESEVIPASRGELPGTNLHEYEYPIRDGVMARLVVPRDVTNAEMKRLVTWARTLAVDYDAE